MKPRRHAKQPTARTQIKSTETSFARKSKDEREPVTARLDHAPGLVYAENFESRSIPVNDAVAKQMGAETRDALIDKSDFDSYPPKVAQRFRADKARLPDGNEPVIAPEKEYTPRRGYRGRRAKTKLQLRNAQDEIIRLIGSSKGISTEHDQEMRGCKFFRAAEQSPVSIMITNTEGVIEYVNPRFSQVTGYTSEEIVGRTPYFMGSWLKSADSDSHLWWTLQAGQSWHGESHDRKKNGELFWAATSISPILAEDGTISHYLSISEDITQQKQAEKFLRQQNAYLDALHETTISLLRHLDLNDLLQEIIRRAADLVGTTHGYIYVARPDQDEIKMSVGIGIFEQMVGTTAHLGVGLTGIVWQTGQALVIEDYQSWEGHLKKPGFEQLHNVVGIPIQSGKYTVGVFGLAHNDPNQHFGKVELEILTRFANLAAVALENARLYEAAKREISERTRAEQDLRQQKELLQTIFDRIPVMIGVLNQRGQFTFVNHEWDRTLGYALEEMNQPDVQAGLYHDADKLRTAAKLMHAPETGGHEFTMNTRAGQTIDTTWTFARLSDEQTIAFGQDITARKQVDRLKSEFVSTVSHELRTPLTSIRGSLGLVVGGIGGPLPERAKTMVEIAYKNSERLVLLVNDILDIEKIESGKMLFTFKPISVMSLLEQAIEANRGFADQYHVELKIIGKLPEAMIYADQDRMLQVLTNLISNACKYSPPGRNVELSVQTLHGDICIAVHDYGPGIPEEFRTRIFQKFAQADASDSRQKGGTGLGLSIAKAVVERHGGRIDFDTLPGRGTTFFFTIPEWLPRPLTMPASETSKPRILICEDDPDVALLLELMLRQYGYVTDTAGDAGHAKALLAQHRYAVLSLDLMLPDQNGISLIRELRATEATRDLPIVVVSATAEQGRQELNGHAFWVADWLSKPIDPNALVRAITHAVHPERGGKPRVLHVEGDADVLQVVTAILADTADVTQARDLAQARQLLDGGVFDLVILDPCLPDGSGAELLPLLQTERPQIPVVLFSEGEQDPAIFHQVNSVLVKSRTSNAQLVETITNLAKVRSGTLGNSRNNDE